MKETDQIEHKGIVKEITGHELQVSIIAQEGCASCNLKGSCSVSDVNEKIIDVSVENPNEFKKGENVTIFYKQSLGFRALFLGYVLPFIILLFTLITSMAMTEKELFSGILSLIVLIPYYLIVYLSKDKIKKTFSFSIKKSFEYPNYNIVSI